MQSVTTVVIQSAKTAFGRRKYLRPKKCMKDKGLIYIFTGDGKGKTSAALGVTLRGLLLGHKVCWISWYKEPSWQISEMKLEKVFDNVEMYWMGKGFYMGKSKNSKKVKIGGKNIKVASVNDAKVFDFAKESEHVDSAKEALRLATNKVSTSWLLVLDEILNAIDDGLVTVAQLKEMLNMRGSTHIVLTGRSLRPQIAKYADLISNIQKIKHPYDEGKLAVRGLDF